MKTFSMKWFLFLIAVMSYIAPIAEASVIAFYKFDDNWHDFSGRYDGVMTGNLTFSTDKPVVITSGKSANWLDSSIARYVAIPATTELSNKFAVTMWIKIPATYTNTVAGRVLLSNNSLGVTNGFSIYLNSWNTDNRRLVFQSGDGTASLTAQTGDNAIPIKGVWHHVAITRNGAAVAFYVNGTLLTPVSSTVLSNFAVNTPIRIGADMQGGNAQCWVGNIDDVAIWNDIPSASVIANLANGSDSPANHLLPPSFPGAEGAGSRATGGRGGDVYHVTNLNDSGAGSLRNGITHTGSPRTIVFDVGGTITLLSRLKIFPGNMTIAGQTAPGLGIMLKNAEFAIGRSTTQECSNVVIRHMKSRCGVNNPPTECFTITQATNIMIDHCSFSWGGDETCSVWDYSPPQGPSITDDITVQWCIISEGIGMGTTLDSPHQYGSLIRSDVANALVSFHHNLYTNQLGRIPRAYTLRTDGQTFLLDWRNNIVYNWGTQNDWGAMASSNSTEKLKANWINNYAIAGPSTTSNAKVVLRCQGGTTTIYQTGNLIDYDRDAVRDGITPTQTDTYFPTASKFTWQGSALTVPAWAAVTTETAASAYTDVLSNAGSFPWNSDVVDTRFVTEVQTNGGSIKTSVPSWPDMGNYTRPPGYDTDLDGMPDAWETAHGLNPNDALDRNLYGFGDEYTNLEHYLNETADQ